MNTIPSTSIDSQAARKMHRLLNHDSVRLNANLDSLNSAMLARSDNDVRVAVIGNVDNGGKQWLVLNSEKKNSGTAVKGFTAATGF